MMQRALIIVPVLIACHATLPDHTELRSESLVLKALRVSEHELVITSVRADARATIEIEHFPAGPLDPSAGYLPDADLGPACVYMILDRRDQVVSMGGVSRLHPDRWLALMGAAV